MMLLLFVNYNHQLVLPPFYEKNQLARFFSAPSNTSDLCITEATTAHKVNMHENEITEAENGTLTI